MMAALFANGLANQPFSRDANDGLTLRDAWISAAVRCAPPDNKPTPAEITNCTSHLHDELAALPNLCVYVALGRIAFDACRRLIAARHGALQPKPFFEHGAVFRVPAFATALRRGRHCSGRVVPPEPSEHEHGTPDAGDAARRLQTRRVRGGARQV